MKIEGNENVICFLGSTWQSSSVYGIYNAAFEDLKLPYVYVPSRASGDPEKVVEALRTFGFHAAGVTIPYKVSVIPYLDDLDETARRVGAVNVIVNEDGRLRGYNTDGEGCVRAIKEQTTVAGKKVVLVGAGGAARAIAGSVMDEGGELMIANRTVEAAEEVAKMVGARHGLLSDLGNVLPKADILIQATPVSGVVPAELLHRDLVVMDIVTNPEMTQLLTAAEAVGCVIIKGTRMLLHQAVAKFKLYTGVEAPIEVMEKALEEANNAGK